MKNLTKKQKIVAITILAVIFCICILIEIFTAIKNREEKESNLNNEIQNNMAENIINNIEQENNMITSGNDDILYEKEVNGNIIRIRYCGAVLAQRSIISVEKSTNGGKTYIKQIENSDGGMEVHNGSEFVFIDENIGFINDPGLAGTYGDYRGLLVTIDGGKSFKEAAIVHPSNIDEENLFVKGVPYIKDEKLRVQIYTINYSKEPSETYYEFTSEDNGITWRYE